MATHAHHPKKSHGGDYVVRSPRATDALGHSLRGAFGETGTPADMLALLRKIDRPAN